RFGKGGRIKNKMIMVTSSSPSDGKTMITSTLGLILSQMGYKVLILDTDMRRPNIHKVFGLKRESGLTDILMGEISPDSCPKTATDLMLEAVSVDKIMDNPWLNNLNIITVGSTFPDTVTLFNSDKMNETLDYLKNKYDVVLVDASPILAVSEPSIIASRMDEILVVFKVGTTSRLVLRSTKNQIESAKGKGALSGVIINNATPEVGRYGYYYYRKYKYYHKEEKSQDIRKGKTNEHV
ncbi:unnamed protein product, partial [marine sediment metagenome]